MPETCDLKSVGACWWIILILCCTEGWSQLIGNAHIQEIQQEYVKRDVVLDVKVSCQPDGIIVRLYTSSEFFNGLIFPKGLSKNSTCMTEYKQVDGKMVQYYLPLRSCNTMSVDVANGIEYFNTIVVQPHRKLVTNQGKGYHIRCRFKTRDTDFLIDPDSSLKINTAAMPGASMKIYQREPVDGQVAESVKIGDPLTLVVGIDHQDIYGMKITECVVRDGLGWSQQVLINEQGCPVDREIMGELEYSSTKTTALVRFLAHKFPHTASVYYQCSIKLCIRHAAGCEEVPPLCVASTGLSKVHGRSKRQLVEQDETTGLLYDTDKDNVKVKVFSGLYVNEANDLDDEFVEHPTNPDTKVYDPNTLCIPQRDFAIGIAIAGLLLIIIVIVVILVLLSRHRRRKNLSTTGSSIYSGPYTNTGYSSYSS